MSRKPRYLPSPGALVEITQRTIQGRYLLKPSRRTNAVVVGCLARAQMRNPGAKVHAVAVLSNHLHLLASFDTVKQMSAFMCHFSTNLSKEIGRLRRWRGTIFSERYSPIPLSEEPEIQLARLRYLLSQGAKEGLVLSPRDWPGVHAAKPLIDGEPLRGIWIDRTKLHRAGPGIRATEADVTSEEILHLTPLPCWKNLSQERRKAEIAEMVNDIELEVADDHKRSGTAPAGLQAIAKISPRAYPPEFTKSPRPMFHAFTKAARTVLVDGYREFVAAYRRAAEALKAGESNPKFPKNCFPPGLPFIPPDPLTA